MEQAINERIDEFIDEFVEIVRDRDDDDDNDINTGDLYKYIEDNNKKIFLINKDNFNMIMEDVAATLSHNLSSQNRHFNQYKVFKSFLLSFINEVQANNGVTNQINETYRNFNNNNVGQMEIEEEEEESEVEDFDDELEFVRIYSNKPRGYKIKQGDEKLECTVTPTEYGLVSLKQNQDKTKEVVIQKFQRIVEENKIVLEKLGYFTKEGGSGVIVGRVVFFENQVKQKMNKDVFFEKFVGDKIKRTVLDFSEQENSFYNGQFMILEVVDNGICIMVKKIIPMAETVKELKEYNEPCNVNMVVVKGPFFTPRRADIACVISKIKNVVEMTKANVLMVKGPIIHSKSNEAVEDSFETIQQSFFSELNQLHVSKIFFVNETSEKTNLPCLPLNPLFSYGLIEMVPNPTVIDINGFSVALTIENCLDKMMAQTFFPQDTDEKKKRNSTLEALHNSQSLLPFCDPSQPIDNSKLSMLDLKQRPDVFLLHSDSNLVHKVQNTLYVQTARFIDSGSFGSYTFVNFIRNKQPIVEQYKCEED